MMGSLIVKEHTEYRDIEKTFALNVTRVVLQPYCIQRGHLCLPSSSIIICQVGYVPLERSVLIASVSFIFK